jgi:hypothetical protein
VDGRSKAIIVLLIVGVSGLLTESVWFTYDYARGIWGDTANSRLYGKVAALSIVYGLLFAYTAVVASPRFSALWTTTLSGRRSPAVVARWLFVVISVTALAEVLIAVYSGLEFGFAYSFRSLLGFYPAFGILLTMVFVIAKAPTPHGTNPSREVFPP